MQPAVIVIAVIIVIVVIIALWWALRKTPVPAKSCNIAPSARNDASGKVPNWPPWNNAETPAQNIASQQAACTSAGYCFNATPSSPAPWCYFPG